MENEITKVTTSMNIEDIINMIGSIANIIIAVLTLCLGYYVFIYQKKKDIKAENENEVLRKKNIKLQWFREIIIQPKIDEIFAFYDNISSIKTNFNKADLNDEEKIKVINFIKKEQSKLRKTFLDLLQHINSDLHNKIKINLDELTDTLTRVITNDELKLNNENTYEREINSKIQKSYSYILSSIFNYYG